MKKTENVIVTKHAKERMIQRLGIPKKSIQRIAEKAYHDGVYRQKTKGRLHKYLTKIAATNSEASNLHLYGDKVFVFNANVLVTVLQIPSNLTKDIRKMII